MPTSIRLPNDVEERLNHLAQATGRTKAFYLRMLIENGLSDLEDRFLADPIMDRVQRGEEKVYSSEEVRKELGLND
jgi:RHH-type rel operon transcriptional repressor/antitoxin RelB